MLTLAELVDLNKRITIQSFIFPILTIQASNNKTQLFRHVLLLFYSDIEHFEACVLRKPLVQF